MKPKRECPLCGNNIVEKIHSIKFANNLEFNKLPENIDIVICTKCCFIYSDMEFSQEEFDNYYRTNSSYSENFNVINHYEDNEYYENIFNELNLYIKSDDNILDIGCGNGNFLNIFYKNGYKNLYGIDQSNAFNNIANKSKINFIDGSIFNINNKLDKKFKLITTTNVLEHIYDIKSFINNIKSLLDEDGFLYIDVPNFKSYSTISHLSSEHINHFSEKSIINMALEYGYVVINLTTKYYRDGFSNLKVLLKKYNFYDDINTFKNYIYNIDNIINNDMLNKLEKSNDKVILWGIANSILPFLDKLSKLNIVNIVDSSIKKQGKILYGHKIISPNEITDKDAIIIILPNIYYKSIYNQIKEMGLKNKVKFLTRPDQTRPDQTRPDQTRPYSNTNLGN